MRFVLFLVFSFCYMYLSAQDIIIRTDQKAINCYLVDIDSSRISYRLSEDTTAPLFYIHLSNVHKIIYADGTERSFEPLLTTKETIRDRYFIPDNLQDNILHLSVNTLYNSSIGVMYERQFNNKKVSFSLPFYLGLGATDSIAPTIKYLIDPSVKFYPFGTYIFTLGFTINFGFGVAEIQGMDAHQNTHIFSDHFIKGGIGTVFQLNVLERIVFSSSWNIGLSNLELDSFYRGRLFNQTTLNIGYRF